VANLHLVRCIRRSLRRGGQLAVVDPLRTKIADQAGLHLQILPGTDVVLGFALATELERAGAFDHSFIAAHVFGAEAFMARAREWPAARAAGVCGVPEAHIHALARSMASARRLVLAPGNGLERGRNGPNSGAAAASWWRLATPSRKP
jgi:anaerobic selenocysteine-containing dehydrogenase